MRHGDHAKTLSRKPLVNRLDAGSSRILERLGRAAPLEARAALQHALRRTLGQHQVLVTVRTGSGHDHRGATTFKIEWDLVELAKRFDIRVIEFQNRQIQRVRTLYL